MSSITQVGKGLTSSIDAYSQMMAPKVGTNSQPLSMFNSDGTIPGSTVTETSRYAGTNAYVENKNWNVNTNTQGGNNMAGNAWTIAGGVNSATGTNTTTGGAAWSFANTPSTTQATTVATPTTAQATVVGGGVTPGMAQPTQTIATSPSGANWGTSTNPNPVVNTGNPVVAGAPDLAAAAVQAIKNLAGKISEIVPRLNDDEFNDLVKIYELAGLKDEFLQKSGRQNSYLDRALLTEALNEVNMVFTENNTKNANVNNALTNIVNMLNTTGQYDARNIYAFIDQAMSSGMIPQTIWQDPMRQHLARVCQMAANHKRGTAPGMSASGANWGAGYNANTNATQGYGAWAGYNTNSGTTGYGAWAQNSYQSTTPTVTANPWATQTTPIGGATYNGSYNTANPTTAATAWYQQPAVTQAAPVAQTPWYQQPTAQAAPAATTPWYAAPTVAQPTQAATTPWYAAPAAGTSTYNPTQNYTAASTGYGYPSVGTQSGSTFNYPTTTPGYSFNTGVTAPTATNPAYTTPGYGTAPATAGQTLGNDTCPVYLPQ